MKRPVAIAALVLVGVVACRNDAHAPGDTAGGAGVASGGGSAVTNGGEAGVATDGGSDAMDGTIADGANGAAGPDGDAAKDASEDEPASPMDAAADVERTIDGTPFVSTSTAGCFVPACTAQTNWASSAGCCHDPCVEGEACSATCTQWNGVSCVCEKGSLSCCTSGYPYLVDCHDPPKCATKASIEACSHCCIASFQGSAIAQLLSTGCYCGATTCASACSAPHDACNEQLGQYAITDGCAACLASHVAACGGPSGFVATCLAPCAPLPHAEPVDGG